MDSDHLIALSKKINEGNKHWILVELSSDQANQGHLQKLFGQSNFKG